MPEQHRIERTYRERVGSLDDARGIESWWAPDAFTVEVEKLELERGGELVYTMTASGPDQVEFMRNAGLPLTSTSRKRFTEVERPRRLAYMSLVDFVPDTPPYEFLTVVELEPANCDVQVSMTVDSMHDQVWTERLIAGRANELDNLAALVQNRR